MGQHYLNHLLTQGTSLKLPIEGEKRNDLPLIKVLGVLSEALLALLARKDHLEALKQVVIGLIVVAFGAVEPFLACMDTHRLGK